MERLDVRWNSPFPYTLAYNLYKKHILELNQIYWAYVPASNTIKKATQKALGNDEADPKTYFLIRDEDDRRVATSYSEWKVGYRKFENYTRLNMVMLISSCFETYLRTVVSQAFESKPGVIIMCPNSVDGAFLLKNRNGYGNGNSKDYQFTDQVDEVCRGDWAKRFLAFEKYFGALPHSVTEQTTALNEYRVLRNNVAHYLGRKKTDYTAPILFEPMDAIEVSHDRVIKYFKLVNDIAKVIDRYLKCNFIGSYDIMKYYYQQVSAGRYDMVQPGHRVRDLKRELGGVGLTGAQNDYYRNIVSFCELDTSSDVCRFSTKACINAINRGLEERNARLIRDERFIRFGRFHLNLFVKANQWRGNPEYCKINANNKDGLEYCYSMRLINQIIDEISQNPSGVIDGMINKVYNNAQPE